MTTLNLTDVLFALLILASAWHGWRRGFVLATFNFVCWSVSLLAGFFLYQPGAELLGAVNDWTETWNQPTVFLLIVATVGLLIQLVGNALLKRLPRGIHRQRANRLFGILPGLADGIVAASIVSASLFAVPISNWFLDRARESWTANYLAVFTAQAEALLHPIFNRAVTETIERVTVPVGSDERVSLPFKVEGSNPRPELEVEMLKLINRERAAAGLASLKLDPELTEVARRHSNVMFVRSYFAHNTPENRTPFDRMRESKVKFLTAGENLALAPTLIVAHDGLMNSPGHRANILKPQYGRVGIGVMDGGRRGLMITQNFRN